MAVKSQISKIISSQIGPLQGKLRSNIQKKVFIRKCGVEDCRGFLSEQWKCGLCDTTTCKKCLEILNKNQDKNQDKDQDKNQDKDQDQENNLES